MKRELDTSYHILVAIGLGLCALTLNGCSSAPSKGSPEYVREQVYSCRMLCANGEVNITKIEGLDCVCNKPQQPFIYNPMMGGSGGGGSSSTSSTGTNSSANDRAPASASPIVINQMPTEKPLTPNANATHTTDATGKEIISQAKE